MSSPILKKLPAGMLPDALGLGLFWVWKNTFATYVASPTFATGAFGAIARCIPYLGPTLAALLMFILVKRVRASMSGLAYVMVTCAAALGSVALSVGPLEGWSPAVLGVLEVTVFGLGTVLASLWGARIVMRFKGNAIICVVFSFCLSSFLYVLVSLFDLPFGVVLFLPLAISALLYAARVALPAFEPNLNGSLRGANISLVLLVLLIGLAELLRVVLTGLFSGGEERVIAFSLATQLACPIVFAALMTICLGPRARGDVSAPARFLLPLLMLGYMSLLLYSNSWVAYAILGAGYWCLYCLTWLFAGDLARCSKTPVLPFALAEGGIGFVAFIVLLVTNACGVDGSALVPSVVLSVLAAAVILALLPGGFARRQASSPKDDGAGWAEDAHAVLSGQGQVKVECDPVALLSTACGLSPREVEVMALLARGRSTPYIQDRLGIAFGTAQAHVRHVYEKTGVHSRQELLDLIESVAENGRVSSQ